MNRELLHKYMAGDASQEEKESVQLWIEADERNRKKFRSARMLYDITLAHLPEEKEEMSSPRSNRMRMFSGLLKIAAAVLITFTITRYFMQPAEEPLLTATEPVAMQTLHVPSGQRAELTLADGTKVWLNSLTTFTFPTQFAAVRDVYLDGEGYFEVKHDENKKFKVNTQKHTITVLGTEFNVFAYSKNNSFETSLINGAVEVTTAGDRQPLSLMPGERACLKDDRLRITSIDHYDYFLWKKGIISFDHERVEDLLGKLELYYDIRIENNNKRINDMRYTGKFRAKEGIEHVLKVLQVPTGLRYQKDSENNLIQIY